VNEKSYSGFLHWVFPAMLALVAAGVVLSGRDLTESFLALQEIEPVRHPAMPWLTRGVSVFVVLASLERIANHLAWRKPVPSLTLAGAFVLFWLTTVAAPALFGANRLISHEYAYSLVIGCAIVLATPLERDKILVSARNTLLVFMLVSVALVPVMPVVVLDRSYTQGMIPGLPRLGGVAPHPVSLGMLAQFALLLLWFRPLRSRWLNVLAWGLGLTVLFLAQSKTAWIAFIVCSLCMVMVRGVPGLWRQMGDPKKSGDGAMVALFCVIVGVLAVMGLVLVGDIGGQVARFLDTPQGGQLASMTGRDRIWAIAIDEWQSSPTFGYGLGIWDSVYRASINMPNATHGHSQWFDTLARSGNVGAAGLLIYASVLFVLSVRYAAATRGFSLALFIALALRSIGEVPLLIQGYGTELFTHLLLIVTLAAAAAEGTRVAPAAAHSRRYGVAS